VVVARSATRKVKMAALAIVVTWEAAWRGEPQWR
jgi:hypothetical protein